jgi:hypothetical protein
VGTSGVDEKKRKRAEKKKEKALSYFKSSQIE